MKKLSLLTVLLLFLAAGAVNADNIYSLIMQGRIKEASDSLSASTKAAIRDGDHLFFQGLLERNATKSAQLLEASLNAAVSASFRQEIYYRLAQYYLLKGDNDKLQKLVADYRAYWEAGKYRPEMFRISILIDEKNGAYDAAVRQVDRYLLEFKDGDLDQWGLIDKARIMGEYDKSVAAESMLRKLSRERGGPGVPQSLYLLANEAIADKHSDDAVFYYNLLREGYPNSIGLSAIVRKMEGLASDTYRDNTAEKLTGTYYVVQVGVFSEKKNAERQADIFKQYDQKVEIGTKTISSTKYNVVYVGRFSSYDAADKFKRKLESDRNEVFQVVAR
ncbi:MAG TPA: SPOR domain-containing protein [candidate division Zixibacteria bacterium]|nr:SPOR domain-containing protein [candidate division Zixibacteria bacterium]